MLATALENNGAIVYIVGRRLSVLEQAAAERNVRRTPTHTQPFDSADRRLNIALPVYLYFTCTLWATAI